MREIKFRAWDKFNKAMSGVSAEQLRSHNFCLFRENCELMQYTGLKDKNGKEIYCSDFVGVSKEKYGKVYWCDDELAWWVEPIGEYSNEPLRGKGQGVEVLGNEYEGLA